LAARLVCGGLGPLRVTGAGPVDLQVLDFSARIEQGCHSEFYAAFPARRAG